MVFADRREAGRLLGERLCRHAGPDTIVLGLARGGVVVADEVARALGAPLEVMITRKVGAPMNPEFAIGAISEGGVTILNQAEVRLLGISDEQMTRLVQTHEREIAELQQRYRGGRPLPSLRGKTAVLVDDGIATGSTMRAAVDAARRGGASTVVVAVPVGPLETIDAFRSQVDEVVCLDTPEPFFAVGAFYQDFSQVDDATVSGCLAQAASRQAAGAAPLCQPSSSAQPPRRS